MEKSKIWAMIRDELVRKNKYSRRFAKELYAAYLDDVQGCLDEGKGEEEAEAYAKESLLQAMETLPDSKENRHMFPILVSALFLLLTIGEVIITGVVGEIENPLEIYINVECCLAILGMVYVICTRKRRSLQDTVIMSLILASLIVSVFEVLFGTIAASSPNWRHDYSYTYPGLFRDDYYRLDQASGDFKFISDSYLFFPHAVVSMACLVYSLVDLVIDLVKRMKGERR